MGVEGGERGDAAVASQKSAGGGGALARMRKVICYASVVYM